MPNLVSNSQPVSYKPTRKWLAAVLSGVGALAVLAIVKGFDQEFQLGVVGLIVTQGPAYLVPNSPEA